MNSISALQKKIVILGGTFDPIHNGHMEMADILFKTFKTKVTFIPTGTPPYKAHPKATADDRLEMLKLAIGKNTNYQIDEREIKSPTYCYSHQSLSILRKQVGNEVAIYFLIGGDSLCSLDTWDYWTELPNLTNFVVANRNGYDLEQIKNKKLYNIINKNRIDDLSDQVYPAGKFYMLNYTPQNVSSTFIRNQVLKRADISDLVPNAVANYIVQRHLYQN